LAESYLNFGWLGPPIQYFGIGLVWGLIWNLIKTRFDRFPAYWKGLYLTLGFYRLIVMHRGGTSLILTAMIQIFVPLLLLSWFLDRNFLSRKIWTRPSGLVES
jgi:hypothetical protein